MDTNRWTLLPWRGLGLMGTVAVGLILMLDVLLVPRAHATGAAQTNPVAGANRRQDDHHLGQQ